MGTVLSGLLLLSGAGCRREPVSDASQQEASRAAPSLSETRDRPEPLLDYIEVLTAHASQGDTLPMVVGIHGLGDTPEDFKELYEALPVPCRVIVPRAFIPWGQGYSWFDIDLPYAGQGGSFSRDVAFAARRVAALVAQLTKTKPTRGKPIISGFSQGGMISFTVAVDHPDIASLVIPIGGALPEGIHPEARRAGYPPIRAIHGADDGIVPMVFARKSIDRLKALGVDAELAEYPGVPHAISPKMRQALYQNVARYSKER